MATVVSFNLASPLYLTWSTTSVGESQCQIQTSGECSLEFPEYDKTREIAFICQLFVPTSILRNFPLGNRGKERCA